MTNVLMDNFDKNFDFVIGVYDSNKIKSFCDFYQLGTYKKCIAVPRNHHLASKAILDMEDLYDENLVMVRKGDSFSNDKIREDIETNHPRIHIESNADFFDLSTFNYCASTNSLLLNVECWNHIHPGLKTIPVNWNYTIPYGLLYLKDKSDIVVRFLADLQALSNS